MQEAQGLKADVFYDLHIPSKRRTTTPIHIDSTQHAAVVVAPELEDAARSDNRLHNIVACGTSASRLWHVMTAT